MTTEDYKESLINALKERFPDREYVKTVDGILVFDDPITIRDKKIDELLK